MTPSTSRFIAAISGIALLVAVLDMPYGYYQLLRWGICLSAAVLGTTRWDQAPYSGSALIIVALLFNPFDPVSFDKGLWSTLDVMAAGVFGWVVWYPGKNQPA